MSTDKKDQRNDQREYKRKRTCKQKLQAISSDLLLKK